MQSATRSPRFILAVLAFGVFVAADDLTVVSTMLRQMVFDLGIPLPDGLDRAAWIVNAYLIAYVVVMPFIGRVGDLLGRRRVYIAALVLFLAGSLWTPFAPDLRTFLASRVITAVGGGAMVPVSMAIIGDIYPRQKRAGALGILGAIDTAGWVWGPLYGALLVRFLTWRWQFYLNIPLALIGIVLAWIALRDLPEPATKTPIDWPGSALLTACLLSLNLGLLGVGDVGAAGGFQNLETESVVTWPYYVVAAATLAAFVLWERRRRGHAVAPPLIDLSLFRRPNFATAIAVNFLVGGILIIAMVNVPLVVNVLEGDAVGRAALVSGGLLSVMTGTMAVAAFAGGRLTERWSYRRPTAAGLVAAAIAFAVMGATWQLTTPYAQMAWQLALLGVGFGLVIAPIGAAVINAAPAADRGVAASLVIVFRLIGMSVGLSALTAWGLRRFNILRVQVPLPPITDPDFGTALIEGLLNVTVTILTETFLVSAGVAAAALAISWRLRHD